MAWSFEPHAEQVVVGTDPEYADMGNPRGNIWRLRYFVWATDDRGYRRGLDQVFKTEAEAETFIASFKGSPTDDDWYDLPPVYGSDAYVAEGTERELSAMDH